MALDCTIPVFKISAGPRTLTAKIWVGPARFGKFSFFIIYKFSQNCASVRQVSDLILKTVIQWIYFTIWKKMKKNHHHYNTILSLYNIISRHYKKSLIRSQIYHGYEELSTDTNYPIWRRQERRSKYAVQLTSWQLRSNSPKMSVRPAYSVCSVVPKFWLDPFHICTSYQATSEGVSRVKFFWKFKNLNFWQFLKICLTLTLSYYIPRIRRIGGCYGFTSKPPAARNGVNAITQKPRDGLFSNLVYTLVVIVSWPD